MNTDFLNIIRRIAAEQGEPVLENADRLKPFIKNDAQHVPQEERRAFGRCIEQGFYRRLKNAATPDERRQLKASLARQLHHTTGMEASLCEGALELLDALVPLPAGESLRNRVSGMREKLAAKGITKKTLIFALSGGAGAFIGQLASNRVRVSTDISFLFWQHDLEMGLWGGFLSVFISAALLTAQHIVQKKRPQLNSIATPLLLGAITGVLASSFAQLVFNFTQHISPAVTAVSNALCWGLLGAGLGWGVSLFVPNYTKKRAMTAGFLGGTLGGAIYVALLSSSADTGSFIGVIVLGLSLGLMISVIEEALREAWLTVIWGRNESTAVSLGKKPVVFGAGRDADIYIAAENREPVRAIVQIENGSVIMYDNHTNRRLDLQNGSRVDLGKVSFIVNIKRA